MGAVHKILVVEADSALGADIERVLSKKALAVVIIANGAEALKMLAADSYAAVFADVDAPGLGGLEVAAQLKAQQPWMPVILIGGGEADDSRARAAGAVGVLRKPLTDDKIEEAARLILESAPSLAAHAETAPASKSAGGIGSLIAAAFIALFTAIAAPAVAVGGWLWLGLESATREGAASTGRTAVARIFLFFLSPFLALFYMGVMPMIGVMELMKLGGAGNGKLEAKRRAKRLARSVGLFFASPLIGLAYIVALPVVAVGAAVGLRSGDRSVAQAAGRVAQKIGRVIAAPFVGLTHVLVYPPASMIMLILAGGRAWIAQPATH